MKAVIMAGGKGTRLRPLTCELPKPMVPLMNVPVMEHIINLLRAHGITEIIVTLEFMPQKIKDYFMDGHRWGVHLYYYTDPVPLGTAGSVKQAEELLDDTFLVISGDCITDYNLTDAIRFHRAQKSQATLIICHVDVPLDYGVVITDEHHHVTGFVEKPSWGEVVSDTVNTGIYVLESSVLDLVETGKPCDFSRDVFPKLLPTPGAISGYTATGYWNDIGSLDSYAKTHQDMFTNLIQHRLPGRMLESGIHVGSRTVVDPDASLRAPCLIGNNCRIGAGAVIEGCIIGDNCVVEENVNLRRCILWNNCFVDFASELRGVILGNRVHMMHHGTAHDGSVIGDETLIRDRVFIKSNIKIWPHKIIESHAIVDRSIVWATRHSNTLFGKNGLTGIVNVDITPEFACRMGSAYGTVMGEDTAVIVASDQSNPSRLFKYAFMAGLMSTGVHIYDINSMFLSITRQAIPLLDVAGGVHIMHDPDSEERIVMTLLDHSGADAGKTMEKTLEGVFFKEEFTRRKASALSRLEEVSNFTDYYVKHLINQTQVEALRALAPQVRVTSTDPGVGELLRRILAQAGCRVSGPIVVDHFSPYLLMQEEVQGDLFMTVFLDANADSLSLMDSTGRTVSEDTLFMLTSMILFRHKPGFQLFAPVHIPSVVEKLAAKYGGRVSWTKNDPAHIIRMLMEHEVFNEPFNQYTLQYDPIASVLRIVEFLTLNHLSLEEVFMSLPAYHMETMNIHCPSETIGRVMRRVISGASPNRVVLTDGVKILEQDGWALILPSTDQPMLQLFAEGSTQRAAQAILRKYAAKVEAIMESTD